MTCTSPPLVQHNMNNTKPSDEKYKTFWIVVGDVTIYTVGTIAKCLSRHFSFIVSIAILSIQAILNGVGYYLPQRRPPFWGLSASVSGFVTLRCFTLVTVSQLTYLTMMSPWCCTVSTAGMFDVGPNSRVTKSFYSNYQVDLLIPVISL